MLDNLAKKIFIAIRRSIYITVSLFAQRTRPGLFVYCYHSIDSTNWQYGVGKEVFEAQLKFLKSNYQSFSAERLSDQRPEDLEQPYFLLTFDDGYKNVLHVRDLMIKYDVKPIVFVIADSSHANKQELENNNELLSLDDIKSLKADGWAIGSHSMTHKDFGHLNSLEIEQEVIGSKKKLEDELGFSIDYFAYPKGKYNQQILDAVKRAGYKFAFSMDDLDNKSDFRPFAISRVGIDRTHTMREFKYIVSKPAGKVRKYIKSLLSN